MFSRWAGISVTPSFWKITGLVVRPVTTGSHLLTSLTRLLSRKWPVTLAFGFVLSGFIFFNFWVVFYHIFEPEDDAVMENDMKSLDNWCPVDFRINWHNKTHVGHFFHGSSVKTGKTDYFCFSLSRQLHCPDQVFGPGASFAFA